MTRPDGDESLTAEGQLQQINAVFGLLLILSQAASPAGAMRLVTTAIPSIAAGHTAAAWHPSRSGTYYQQAPGQLGLALARLTGPGRLDVDGPGVCWAFPLTAALGQEPVFLVTTGPRDLSQQSIFLLSVLAQICGTVVANHELSAEAELRAQANRERDIAQARAAELAGSEARQRAVLEAALDAVVTIDQRSQVTYVNSAFEQTFGCRAADVVGRELAEVIIPPAQREAHRQGVARYLATGEAHILDQRIEVAAQRADGTGFPAEVTVTRTGLPGEPSFTGYIRDITERQRAQQELMASRARLVTASDAARQRVTRDLHDGAQQWFVTALINLQLAGQKWESAPSRARELLDLAMKDARHGVDDLREIAAGIHPAILTQRGLAAAIGSLAARLPIPVDIDVPDARLPEPVEVSVYFFCSEGLTNVVKHAQARSAWVRVEISDGHCRAEVRDDGIGGARPRSDSSGLAGLRDRIGALGGTMDIGAADGGGTTLRAAIPLGR
ncbi:MAG TPA: PAS domain S-box protein [Streptosporangiaceae bacterium]|jgi:PAS domain S-box-containing protein